jgi:hypothetical protein
MEAPFVPASQLWVPFFGGGRAAPKEQGQTQQQIQQACINGWYQSPIGKVDDFLSIGGLTWSPNAKENWKEILTLGAAKYLGFGSCLRR